MISCPPLEGEGEKGEEEEDQDQKFGALVAVKSFLKFLTCHMFSSSTVACEFPIYVPRQLRLTVFQRFVAICANYCIIMYVYIGEVGDTGGVITFYIPARLDDAE